MAVNIRSRDPVFSAHDCVAHVSAYYDLPVFVLKRQWKTEGCRLALQSADPKKNRISVFSRLSDHDLVAYVSLYLKMHSQFATKTFAAAIGEFEQWCRLQVRRASGKRVAAGNWSGFCRPVLLPANRRTRDPISATPESRPEAHQGRRCRQPCACGHLLPTRTPFDTSRKTAAQLRRFQQLPGYAYHRRQILHRREVSADFAELAEVRARHDRRFGAPGGTTRFPMQYSWPPLRERKILRASRSIAKAPGKIRAPSEFTSSDTMGQGLKLKCRHHSEPSNQFPTLRFKRFQQLKKFSPVETQYPVKCFLGSRCTFVPHQPVKNPARSARKFHVPNHQI